MLRNGSRWMRGLAASAALVASVACGQGGSDGSGSATDWAIVSLEGFGTTGEQTLMGGERVFTYDYDDPDFESGGTWEISRVAGADGSVLIDWDLEGFHGFFFDWVTIEFFVRRHRSETVDVLVATDQGSDDGPNTIDGPFSFGGTVDAFVEAGATYGFRIRGGNFDSGGALQGEFTLLE